MSSQYKIQGKGAPWPIIVLDIYMTHKANIFQKVNMLMKGQVMTISLCIDKVGNGMLEFPSHIAKSF